METWKLILTPKLPGSTNMQYDLKMFYDFEEKVTPSVLRIYSWQPKCISLGYSQKIEEEIDVEKAKLLGWDVVRRPTGGGIVFHNTAEVTYSLVTAIDNPLLPKGLVPSYKKISEAIIIALSKIGVRAEIQSSPRHSLSRCSDTVGNRDPDRAKQASGRSCHPSPSSMERGMNSDDSREKGVRSLCFSYPAEYEIVVKGKKIVGSAQKRGRRALLQQGSIFVRRIEPESFSILKNGYVEQDAVSVEEVLGREVGFEELSFALVEGFKEGLGVKFG